MFVLFDPACGRQSGSMQRSPENGLTTSFRPLVLARGGTVFAILTAVGLESTVSDELAHGQPVHDHFKKIDDDAVMGLMNGKNALDNGRYAYFYLERP
jgi:uncharacterized protein DUF4334